MQKEQQKKFCLKFKKNLKKKNNALIRVTYNNIRERERERFR